VLTLLYVIEQQLMLQYRM